jgi:tRNA A-37 threonylcarbamoyl transferase component Bud32
MLPSSGMIGRRYRLDNRLAVAAFNDVWQATDVVLRRQVAVKLLRSVPARDDGKLERFRTEARHAGALSHANIARIYDYAEPPPPDLPFMVMELVRGPSVAAVLAGGPLDPARVVDIMAQAAAGLAAAHRTGLVHGGITPSSLLLAPGDVVKITNFGLSQPARAGSDRKAGQQGEVQPAPDSDLCSLGMVAHACLVGGPALTGVCGQVDAAECGRLLPSLPESVPSSVAALVAELTAKDPAARPRSAADVARRATQLHNRMKSSTAIPAPVRPTGAVATADGRPVPGPPRLPAGGHRGRRIAIGAGMAVAATMSLILASATGAAVPGRAERVPASTAGPAAPGNAALTVLVDSRSLIGQPVSAVVRRLHGLGLEVRLRWERSDQLPGTALAVRPGGRVASGSLITLTGAFPPHSGPQSRRTARSARPARSRGHRKRAAPGHGAPSQARPGPHGQGNAKPPGNAGHPGVKPHPGGRPRVTDTP